MEEVVEQDGSSRISSRNSTASEDDSSSLSSSVDDNNNEEEEAELFDDDADENPRPLQRRRTQEISHDEQPEEESLQESLKRQFRQELENLNPSVETLVDIVMNYGGDGALLWETVQLRMNVPGPMENVTTSHHVILFNYCLDRLRDDVVFGMMSNLVVRNPKIRLNTITTTSSNRNQELPSFLHLALERRFSVNNQLIQVLAHPDLATLQDSIGRTPAHIVCGSDRYPSPGSISFSTFLCLVYANLEALQMPCSWGQTPLHSACMDGRDPLQRCAVIQTLVDLCPGALTATTTEGFTPIMIAIATTSAQMFGDHSLISCVLLRMIRQAPESIRVISTGQQFLRRYCTALYIACSTCPRIELVALLVELWPIALFVRTLPLPFSFENTAPQTPFDAVQEFQRVRAEQQRQRSDIQQVQDLVKTETIEMVQALIEVLLHETLRPGLVLVDVTNHIRTTIQDHLTRSNPVDADTALTTTDIRALLDHAIVTMERPTEVCNAILHHESLQELLRDNEPIRDFVTGLYRMNKAGRHEMIQATEAAASPDAIRHLDSIELLVIVVEAASENLDCLLVLLRDCGGLILPD